MMVMIMVMVIVTVIVAMGPRKNETAMIAPSQHSIKSRTVMQQGRQTLHMSATPSHSSGHFSGRYFLVNVCAGMKAAVKKNNNNNNNAFLLVIS